MPKSQIDSAALVAAALAAAFALMMLSGPFAWMASILGLILVVVLFAFDQEGYRTISQSLGFTAVCGFCFAIACGAVFQLLAARGEVHLANGQWSTEWLPFTWVFATVILWAIDRTRMSGRVSGAEPYLSRTSPTRRSFIPDTEPTAPAAAYTPDVAATAPAPSAGFEPQTAYAQQTVPQQSIPQQPVSQQPLYADPPPVPESQTVGTVRPQSMLTHAPADHPVRPSPAPIVPRSGKETMIYVSLVGEGLNVLRSVRAEHLGRDFYKIIDIMPEGEEWQFQPGQVVRCKKKTLSSGKALVATEEAPRAQ